jgi:hypothetical protein
MVLWVVRCRRLSAGTRSGAGLRRCGDGGRTKDSRSLSGLAHGRRGLAVAGDGIVAMVNTVGIRRSGGADRSRSPERPAHLLAGCNALAAALLFRTRLFYRGARGRCYRSYGQRSVTAARTRGAAPGSHSRRDRVRIVSAALPAVALLQVIAGAPQGAAHRLAVFRLALGGSLVLAHPIERRKAALKRGLRSGLDLVRRRRRCAAIERGGHS